MWKFFFEGGNAEKCVNYVEDTLDYAEISTVNNIGNKAFPMYHLQQWKEKYFKLLPAV